VSDVSSRIASLSPQERAALVMQLKRKAQEVEKSDDHAIPRRQNRMEAPLSFAQQGLWFVHQLDPATTAYNLPFYYRLTGQLDTAALARALNHIIHRHEILRTVFTEKGHTVVQTVLPAFQVELPLIDMTAFSRAEAEREIQCFIDSETDRPFNLAEGPLLRARLLKLSEDEHGFLLVIHHIVTDGWSMDLFLEELVTVYEAYTADQPSPLQELPVQYGDFAAWQRKVLSGSTLEAQLTYWKRQLGGELPLLELRTDHTRPLRPAYHGADEWFDATQDLTEKLNELSRNTGATLYMTLLAAFLTLLHKYTQQEDIVVGAPIAGRNHAQIENLIGDFVNTLALRTDLSGNPTFRELLAHVREVALGAYEHQDIPLERLVEELQPQRNTGRQPFFQVTFNLQNSRPEEPAATGLKITLQDFGNQARFDLEFHLWVVPEGLAGPLVYNTALFEKASIARMLTHFQTLLEEIVANPDAKLSELRMLTGAEEEQLHQWNQTTTDYGRDECVHQLVEGQAAAQPDAVAVVYGKQQLSYRELNERANQLAHYLRRRGVGLEVRVGVQMERSVEFVVALLAILKAGGAYVPLDGMYPKQRLQFMLEDAGVQVLLSDADETASGVEVLNLARAEELLAAESLENLENLTGAEDLAYVMYTSGSTGQPKGVAIPHRAINRLVRQTNYVKFAATDRVAQTSNASFDAATFEIWGALLNGARLIVLAKETVLTAVELKRAVAAQRISVMFLTTALFNQMAQSIPEAFGRLRYLVFGGEASDAQAVRRVLEAGKPEHVVNGYGPTEATTFTVAYDAQEVAGGLRTLPIGRVLSNSEVWVLDQELRLAPVGVVGELYIGGDGIAREYLGQAELTAEKFVPHGYSAAPGARLYRTGDLGRYLSDGTLEFVKRIDHQVKIRGFRVELGEIEAALNEYWAVTDSVVVDREDAFGGTRLIGYVVPEEGVEPTSAELYAFLKEKIPAYMLPSVFVMINELPLTPNGKVNRSALPVPELSDEEAKPNFVAPRNALEEKLAGIWQEILGLPQVGVESNFFDLGGHSLMATRVVSQIRERCGVEMPLRMLFESPTIAELARYLETSQSKETELARIMSMLENVESISDEEVTVLLAQAGSAGAAD
jgi:amino acid adenylation domain-containing protein